MNLPVPLALRELQEEVAERVDNLATDLNEYGYDPFGMSPDFLRRIGWIGAVLYRYYFRVETHGVERVPPGRVLLIGNHAGNTIPMDGGMLGMALLL